MAEYVSLSSGLNALLQHHCNDNLMCTWIMFVYQSFYHIYSTNTIENLLTTCTQATVTSPFANSSINREVRVTCRTAAIIGEFKPCVFDRWIQSKRCVKNIPVDDKTTSYEKCEEHQNWAADKGDAPRNARLIGS